MTWIPCGGSLRADKRIVGLGMPADLRVAGSRDSGCANEWASSTAYRVEEPAPTGGWPS